MFTANPASTAQAIVTRTPAQLRADIGANNASNLTTGTLTVARGGTGQTTLALARNAMGLGNTTGAVPIANGGTGATTAAAARNALGLGNTTGALPVANGGTGISTLFSAGRLLYTASTSQLAQTDIGSTGQFLQSNGTFAPLWTNIAYNQRLNTTTGLVATLLTGTNLVTLTSGTTANLTKGQTLTKTSGTGVFGTGARVGSITSSTTFLVQTITGGTIFHTTAGSITFTANGAVPTDETTTATPVFEIAVPSGTYNYELVGTLNKIGGTNKRYEVYITFATAGTSSIFGYAQFSPTTGFIGTTGNAMSSSNSTIISTATTSLTSLFGQGFAGPTNTTQVSNMPFKSTGLIDTGGFGRTIRVHIRQSAAASFNRVQMNIGSYFRLIRVS